MLVAVIYVALAFGPVAGLMAGTAGGLVQDALAGGIVGVGGFSKTLVGFLVGLLGAQFIVAQSLPRFVMFVAGTARARALLPGPFCPRRDAGIPDALVGGDDSGGGERRHRHPGVPDRGFGAGTSAAPAGARRYTK